MGVVGGTHMLPSQKTLPTDLLYFEEVSWFIQILCSMTCLPKR